MRRPCRVDPAGVAPASPNNDAVVARGPEFGLDGAAFRLKRLENRAARISFEYEGVTQPIVPAPLVACHPSPRDWQFKADTPEAHTPYGLRGVVEANSLRELRAPPTVGFDRERVEAGPATLVAAASYLLGQT